MRSTVARLDVADLERARKGCRGSAIYEGTGLIASFIADVPLER